MNPVSKRIIFYLTGLASIVVGVLLTYAVINNCIFCRAGEQPPHNPWAYIRQYGWPVKIGSFNYFNKEVNTFSKCREFDKEHEGEMIVYVGLEETYDSTQTGSCRVISEPNYFALFLDFLFWSLIVFGVGYGAYRLKKKQK
ncbi:MAG: hypothetical protein WC495_01995 [Patescibacteria group bacterium]|jgi:hypothetical protein